MHERLKVFEWYMPSNFVLFDHNPEQMRVSRRAKGGGRSASSTGGGNSGAGGDAGHLPLLSLGNDPVSIQVSKARLVGPETKLFCDRLLQWLSPSSGLGDALMQITGVKSPLLLMQWGPPMMGFSFSVVLAQADITYTRVSAAGIPTHASVNLVFKEEPTTLPMTNPTSGGRPGRKRHRVVGEETLMEIATRAYGDPNAWRAIAKVNRIDDPESIRPGDDVYLPARDELAELAGADA